MVPASIARRTTGQVLTILGIANGLAGDITMALTSFYAPEIWGPLHGSGAILCSIGAPLWMSGSKLVPANGSSDSATAVAPGFDIAKGVTLEPNATGFTMTF